MGNDGASVIETALRKKNPRLDSTNRKNSNVSSKDVPSTNSILKTDRLGNNARLTAVKCYRKTDANSRITRSQTKSNIQTDARQNVNSKASDGANNAYKLAA